MNPYKNEKIRGLLLVLVCYAAFVSVFVAAMADAFNTDPYHFLQG